MSSLSAEDLQVIALEEWKKRRALSHQLWQELAARGQYEWAVEQQAKVFGAAAAPPVPSLEALRAPPPAEFLLTPPPTPPPQPNPVPSLLSTRRRNRGRQATEAVLARRNKEQALAYSPRHFVMFALPHKRLKGDATVYERVNGSYRFRITTRNGSTVPYGQDRLFPIWLATAFQAAGQPSNNVIRFRATADILTAFQQADDGAAHAALRERIQRWYHTTIDVFDDRLASRDIGERYDLIRRVDLWYHQHASANQYTLWQNVIELDGQFADDIRRGAIPIDFETVVALRTTPGALDLYIWQAHRSWELTLQGATRPVAVPMRSLLLQLGTQSPKRLAKRYLIRWQAIVKELWRGCPNGFDPTQELFFLYPGKAVFGRASTKLPGVLPEPPVPLRAFPGPPGPEAAPKRLLLTPPAEPEEPR